MARILILIVAAVTVLALVEGRRGRPADQGNGGRQSCSQSITKFEACLRRGYESNGCVSGDGQLMQNSNEVNRCRKLERRVTGQCGYSCEPELPYDLNCMKRGLNFWGADMRDFDASSFEECAMACIAEPGCKSITSRNSDLHCWLKNKNSGENGPSNNAGMTSMNMNCDLSEVDDSCKRDNKDFWGSDITDLRSEDFNDCAAHCRDTEDCQSFSFRKSDDYCWLKDRTGGWSGPSPNDDRISMNIHCLPGFDASDRTCAMDGYNFFGADLRDYGDSSYEDCRTSCFDTAACVAFTLRKSDNNCWLKNREGGWIGPNVDDSFNSANMNC